MSNTPVSPIPLVASNQHAVPELPGLYLIRYFVTDSTPLSRASVSPDTLSPGSSKAFSVDPTDASFRIPLGMSGDWLTHFSRLDCGLTTPAESRKRDRFRRDSAKSRAGRATKYADPEPAQNSQSSPTRSSEFTSSNLFARDALSESSEMPFSGQPLAGTTEIIGTSRPFSVSPSNAPFSQPSTQPAEANSPEASAQHTPFEQPFAHLISLDTLLAIHANATTSTSAFTPASASASLSAIDLHAAGLPTPLIPHLCNACRNLRGIYVGETSNLRARFERHASNLAKPLRLIKVPEHIAANAEAGNQTQSTPDAFAPSASTQSTRSVEKMASTFTKNLVAARVFALREHAKKDRQRLSAVFIPITIWPSSTRSQREVIEYWVIQLFQEAGSLLLNEKGARQRTPAEAASLETRRALFEHRTTQRAERQQKRIASSEQRRADRLERTAARIAATNTIATATTINAATASEDFIADLRFPNDPFSRPSLDLFDLEQDEQDDADLAEPDSYLEADEADASF